MRNTWTDYVANIKKILVSKQVVQILLLCSQKIDTVEEAPSWEADSRPFGQDTPFYENRRLGVLARLQEFVLDTALIQINAV
jgi:hypothetical protein